MLQQTRVAAMLPRFHSFMEAFPNVFDLAAATEQEVLAAWRGLGYYSRARNLHKAAREIVETNHGLFPSERSAALRLPGVGDYTASAVLSIAYGAEDAAVDGNVRRVVARLAGDSLTDVRAGADALLMKRGVVSPGDHNQAMMELGAMVCLPQKPRCAECPFRSACRGYALHGPEVDLCLPARRSGREPVEVDLQVFVPFEASGRGHPERTRLLLVRDPGAPLLSELWFFPYRAVQAEGVLSSSPSRLAYATPGLDATLSTCKPSSPPTSLRFRHTITHHRLQGTARLLALNSSQSREWKRSLGQVAWKLVAATELEDWIVSSVAAKLQPLLLQLRPEPGEPTDDAR